MRKDEAEDVASRSPESGRDDLLEQMMRKFEQISAELAEIKANGPASSRGPAHLRDAEISIGMAVVAKVGPRGKVLARVVDIYKSTNSGRQLYEIQRTDGGKKGLGPKPASDLYPAPSSLRKSS